MQGISSAKANIVMFFLTFLVAVAKWRRLSGGTYNDPQDKHTKSAHEAHCAQDQRQVMVLFHRLQVSGVLLLLRVEREEDGWDGTEEADPSNAPEHGARG